MRGPRRQRPGASAGLHFDDRRLESRLVWIWGAPRTGSTWLLRQLCHPLALRPNAPAGFRLPTEPTEPLPPRFDVLPVDESFIPNHLAPAFADPVELDGSYVPGTLNSYAQGQPGYVFSERYADSWRPQFRRLGLVRLHSIVERAEDEGVPLTRDPLLIIKEGNGSHASDLTMALFPTARMIFLARDGRDVVDSLLAAYQPGGFFARNFEHVVTTEAERAETVAWASRLWAANVDVTMRAYTAHPPQLRRIVRYEDLLADTLAAMTSLFSWLGLPRGGDWLERMVSARSFAAVARKGPGEPNRAASPGLWREHLTSEEQATMARIMGPRLAALGYPE